MRYEPIIQDAYYHIYNLGNNRENLFKEERNYEYFLRLMQKYVIPVCEVYAYCLLKNHFHILVKTKVDQPDKRISQNLSNLFNTYAKAINKAYNRSGSLFKVRFSRKKINTENYMRQLVAYVHLNAEHHSMIDDFRNYKYSSYPYYLSDSPSFLHTDYILALFDGKSNFEYFHLEKKLKIKEF